MAVSEQAITGGAAVGSAPTLHQRADGLALAAVLFAALCAFLAYLCSRLVNASVESLGVAAPAWSFVGGAAVLAVAALFLPAARAWTEARRANLRRDRRHNTSGDHHPARGR